MSRKLKIKKRKGVSASMSPAQSRYRFKAGFADAVKKTALQNYRVKRGKAFELCGSDVLRSLEFLEDYTETLPVTNINTPRSTTMTVVRLTKLAKLLNTSYQTIWRWSSETQQLPEPTLIEETNGRARPVYHIEEVKVMIQVLGEHLFKFRYYRKDHSGTRNRLFNEIETLRQNNYGELTNDDQTQRKKTSKKQGKRSRRG